MRLTLAKNSFPDQTRIRSANKDQWHPLNKRRAAIAQICYRDLEDMVNDSYLPILILLIGAFGFAVAPLALAWLWAKKFSPAKPGPSKNSVYECGLEAKGDAWIQFNPGYYLYAIIFLVFDVEVVFLLPFATAFTHFGMGECLSMLTFLLLLIEGLAWAWQKNVLTWS